MSSAPVRLLLLGEESAPGQALERLARERAAGVVRVGGPPPDGDFEDVLDRAFVAAAEDAPVTAVVYVLSCPSPVGRLGDWSLAGWEESIVVRLRLAFMVARRAVDEFLGSGEGGRLVFLANTTGSPGDAAREVLHGALRAFVRSVAKEYGPKGVGCNAVLAEEGTPRETERAAETAWMLLSPEGAYVTGEVIELAAGQGVRNSR